MALGGDLVGHDQMGRGIDNALNIIASMPAVLRAGSHGTRVGIGQGYLAVRRIIQGLLHRRKPFDLAPDARIATGQAGGSFGPGLAAFLTVDPFGLPDIATSFGFQMRKAAGDLPFADVTLTVVDRLEFAAAGRDPIP
ncbi:hypothetical protein, partial [Paracoccus sp. IB05]|uniref:hypothetical protein n=1 Tax=Paracoccus sp. IB05 TaxID=2779367 RepID=UPI001E598B84